MTGILRVSTMGKTLLNWRVFIAVIFSIALILGAYIFARGIESPAVAQASTESALLKVIANKDTDTDGLPNWEELLYGTSPTNPDTNGLGMTDGEAVARGLIVPRAVVDIPTTTTVSSSRSTIDPSLPPPPAKGTLTASFTRNLFSLYTDAVQRNNGERLTSDQLKAISQTALTNLAQSIVRAPDFKTANDLTVSGSGTEALKAYAVSAETAFASYPTNAKKSEIFYLQDVVKKNDTTALTHIVSIAKGYRIAATVLSALPVPTELASADLSLVNAFARLAGIIQDFTVVNSDPLTTMIAIQQYPNAVSNLSRAFLEVHNVYKIAGISLVDGTPGAAFVNLIPDIVAAQKAVSTTP